jgi:hypothetical protein
MPEAEQANMSKIVQYQGRDAAVVDYELFELPELEYTLRGPQPTSLDNRHYAAVIGAGQSFGVLVRDPYVHKLQRAIGFPFLNLSVGGSAPGLYLRNPAYLDYVNRSRFCIVQVLSARGSENSYFEARHGKNMLRPRGSKLPFVPGDTAFEKMIEHEPPALVRAVIGEVRANWIREMIQLLAKIHVPKILLWFSKRTPDYREGRYSYKAMAGVFPQFVNRWMVNEVMGFADQYVEVVTSRGMPHILLDRSTDLPIEVFLGDAKVRQTVNTYYPSPEMHEDAFAQLLPALQSVIAETAVRRKRQPAIQALGADT